MDLHKQESPRALALKKELQRRSNDTILVYNPTDTDFRVTWDGLPFVIPSKNRSIGFGLGQQQLPRYIAMNYIKHMADKVLNDSLDTASETENQKRRDTGRPEMDPFEREKFESRYKITDPQLRTPIIRELWLGIIREFGMDEVPEVMQGKSADHRPMDTQILDEIGILDRRVTDDSKAALTEDDDLLNKKSVFELQAIARTQGLNPDKKTKKDELIDMIKEVE